MITTREGNFHFIQKHFFLRRALCVFIVVHLALLLLMMVERRSSEWARTWKAKVMSSLLHSSANSNCFNVRKNFFSPLTFFPLSVSVQFNWKTIWFWRVEMFSELFFPSLLICPAQQRHYRSCRMGRSVREATQSSTVRTAQKKRVKKFFMIASEFRNHTGYCWF